MAKDAKGAPKDAGDPRKIVASNKSAPRLPRRGRFEAGLVLKGTEVKSLRLGRATLVHGFVDIDGGEAWLHGVNIPEYAQGTWTNDAAKRKRKLLLNGSRSRRSNARSARRATPSSRCPSTS